MSAPQAQNEVESRLLLDVVICERTIVLELFAGKDQALLIGRNALLVLNLLLYGLNLVGCLNIHCNGFPGQCLDKDLHFVSCKQMGAPKTTADKVAFGALLVALLAGISATVDFNSSASNDPWFLPVIVAAILTLLWY
jgi:hypothetical protein